LDAAFSFCWQSLPEYVVMNTTTKQQNKMLPVRVRVGQAVDVVAQRQGWEAVPLFASTEERNAIRRSHSKGLNTPRLVSVLVGRWLHLLGMVL
jgi:hypothetical protein